MVFAHTEKKISLKIYLPVRVAQFAGWCQRLWFGTVFLEIKSLIDEVGKNDSSMGDSVIAATVFVHARARVESRRCDIRQLSIRGAPHDNFSSTFMGAPFDPVDIVAIHSDLLEPNLTGSHKLCSDWRFPGSVGVTHTIRNYNFIDSGQATTNLNFARVNI
jgi:hypothetical protein